MNAAQLDRFDRFFDENFATIVDDVALNDPSEGVLRTRAGFAAAYRFWSKVEDDGDPVSWVRRVIAEDHKPGILGPLLRQHRARLSKAAAQPSDRAENREENGTEKQRAA